MNALDAAATVLEQAKTPLPIREITDLILAQDLWQTQSKIPMDTIGSRIAVDIVENKARSRFQRTNKGIFALRAWGLPEFGRNPSVIKKTYTILEAAESVLAAAQKPLDSDELSRRMQTEGLWQARGKTPAASVSASLAVDILNRGVKSRFQRTDRGVFALRAWGLPEYKRQALSSSPDTQDLQQQLDAAQERISELEAEIQAVTTAHDAALERLADLETRLEDLKSPPAPSYPDELNGEQHKIGREAFLAAFPAFDDLEQMVKLELDQNLNSIVVTSDLGTVVFRLFQWAETRGQLPALLNAAAVTNPGNPKLQRWLESLKQAPRAE